MAQVKNNSREQAMKADLPAEATKAIVGALGSHQAMAKRLLSDEFTRNTFLSVVYELLKSDAGTGLITEARDEDQ
jgi:type I restriction enzyme R subunit